MQDDNIMNNKSVKEFPTFLNDPISLEPISNPVWTKLGNLYEHENLEQSLQENGLDHFGNVVSIDDTTSDEELKSIISLFKQETSNSN